jgi:RNA exonuclease 4
MGKCRNGEACPFSHALPAGGPPSPAGARDPGAPPPKAAPPPTVVTLPPGAPVYSIDVECVATGRQHHDRAVAQISLVDGQCTPLLNLYVRPEAPVVSYLTPLTGLTEAHLAQHGVPLADAMATLRSRLPPSAVLVGQNIAKDVEWLGLTEGRDYAQVRHRADIVPRGLLMRSFLSCNRWSTSPRCCASSTRSTARTPTSPRRAPCVPLITACRRAC